MSTTANAPQREPTAQPEDIDATTTRSRREDPWYSSYAVIGVIAADDTQAARKLREAEKALQAIDGITLCDGDLFEETYRRGEDKEEEDVRVRLALPDA